MIRGNGPLPWMSDALCAEVATDMFFPEHGDKSVEARKICAACPVKTPCLAYAVAERGLEGIWGGTTASDRDAIRRARRAA
jgi:WhiB family redox-sensing transcriptional regulator